MKNQLVFAAENFGREENLSPISMPKISKGIGEQLKLAHTVVDIVDRERKASFDIALVQFAQAREFMCPSPFFARKKEEEWIYQFI